MNKDTILQEIRRTAAENGGVPVGSRKFAQLVLLSDGETVHNAFFDRGFKP